MFSTGLIAQCPRAKAREHGITSRVEIELLLLEFCAHRIECCVLLLKSASTVLVRPRVNRSIVRSTLDAKREGTLHSSPITHPASTFHIEVREREMRLAENQKLL